MSTSLIKIVYAEIYQNNLIYFRISIIISRKRSNILPSGEEINMKTCKDAAKEKRPLPEFLIMSEHRQNIIMWIKHC